MMFTLNWTEMSQVNWVYTLWGLFALALESSTKLSKWATDGNTKVKERVRKGEKTEKNAMVQICEYSSVVYDLCWQHNPNNKSVDGQKKDRWKKRMKERKREKKVKSEIH